MSLSEQQLKEFINSAMRLIMEDLKEEFYDRHEIDRSAPIFKEVHSELAPVKRIPC